jgi:26S proteasome regulatory subunit N2
LHQQSSQLQTTFFINRVQDFRRSKEKHKEKPSNEPERSRSESQIERLEASQSSINLISTMSTAVLSTTTIPVATASGWLALLQEPDVTLQSHALTKLLGCVETLWHEVAEALPDLEALAENLELPAQTRQTAAAVASRVFFHLGEPQQALRLALEAGELDFTANDPYSKRLVSAALDAYIAHRRKQEDEEETTADAINLPIVPLQALVHKLLKTSCEKGHAADALGIAMEAREADQVQSILEQYPHLCAAALEALKVSSSKAFRTQVLQAIAGCLNDTQVDLRVLVHQLLKQPEPVAQVLNKLLMGNEEDSLLGFQVCFDLIDSGDQAFVQTVATGVAASFANDAENARWLQAQRILVGGFESELALSFLHKQSSADRLIMEQMKKALEERGSGGRNSILHNAAVMTHAYLYAGTTNDSFLRDYLDWMKKASNW